MSVIWPPWPPQSTQLLGRAENRMVEKVVSIEAELCFDALGNCEVLRQRHVVVEGMRTAV